MFTEKWLLKKSLLAIMGFVFVGFFLSSELEAATVLKCYPETRQCKIRLEDGNVGNEVEVLNENALIVAYGWIVKRQGIHAYIAFKEIKTAVRRGYPVMIKLSNKHNNLQWAASFSDKD